MSQKLLLDGFIWVEETSEFNEDLIQNYKKDGNRGHFIEYDIYYRKKLNERHNDNDLAFLPEIIKIKKSLKTCNQRAQQKSLAKIID